MSHNFPINKFNNIKTPFYYYDSELLRDTLSSLQKEIAKYDNYYMHYAIKANSNPKILKIIAQYGFGAEEKFELPLTPEFPLPKLSMPV